MGEEAGGEGGWGGWIVLIGEVGELDWGGVRKMGWGMVDRQASTDADILYGVGWGGGGGVNVERSGKDGVARKEIKVFRRMGAGW